MNRTTHKPISTKSPAKEDMEIVKGMGSLRVEDPIRSNPTSVLRKIPNRVRSANKAPLRPSTGQQVKVPSPRPTPPKSPRIIQSTKPVQTRPTPETKKIEVTKFVPKPSDPSLLACKMCGRYFAPERIEKHEKICNVTSSKRRKPFDPSKQRLEGTDAEAYVGKAKTSAKPIKPPKKSDWRKKHEEFITNIRAAKQAQAYVAKGGKLSDLPPPPPLDTSDYIPCPHCGRKFNSNAAERHIPKCANIISRPKPKPTTRKTTR